jgi:hypothetical protein
LYPILANGLGQLVQSGINFRWEELKQVREQLFEARNLNETDYKMIYAKSMSRLKQEIIFSEANSVSLESTKYVFAICAILLAFGLVAFLIEIQTSTTVKKFIPFYEHDVTY